MYVELYSTAGNICPLAVILYFKEVITMDSLKKIFPYSFKAKKGLGDLIINILIYIVVGAIAGFLIGILKGIPVIGLLAGLVCGLIDLYVVVGAIISVLDYLKVLK